MREDIIVLLKKEERSKKSVLPLVENFIDQTKKSIQEKNFGDTWHEEELLEVLEAYRQSVLSSKLPSYRKVVYLKKIGYPQTEIAQILGKSKALISQLIKRTKEK